MNDDLKDIICQLKDLNQKFDLLIRGLVSSGRLSQFPPTYSSVDSSKFSVAPPFKNGTASN